MDLLKAAGHRDTLALLSGENQPDKYVIKATNLNEARFYELATREHSEFAASCVAACSAILELGRPDTQAKMIYLGINWDQLFGGNSAEHLLRATHVIVLQNICAGFKLPCAMDIKLGRRHWEDSADEEKRARMDAKSRSSTSWELYARVAGAVYWDAMNTRLERISREDGYRMLAADFKDAFVRFFDPLCIDSKTHRSILLHLIERLVNIRNVLSSSHLRLYGASLLIVYDAHATNCKDGILRGDLNKATDAATACDVRLIDFAHSHWQNGAGTHLDVLLGIDVVTDTLRDM